MPIMMDYQINNAFLTELQEEDEKLRAWDKLNAAIKFAVEKHAFMTRKGAQTPYIVHPLEALAIAAGMTEDKEVLAAAVLHDVLEETDATEEEIKKKFGERVLELVLSDSEDKRGDDPAAETWQIRKQETIDFLAGGADRDAKIIALADKLANLRSIWADQAKIGDALWERFNMKDKEMHRWYYSAVADALADLDSTERLCPAYREYVELIGKVFG